MLYRFLLIVDLLELRVLGGLVFDYVGVDFVRFVYVKGISGMKKVYICLFICVILRVLYFELILDLLREVFIRCLKWFIGKYGRLVFIMIDNVKIFKWVNRELGWLFKNKEILDFVVN